MRHYHQPPNYNSDDDDDTDVNPGDSAAIYTARRNRTWASTGNLSQPPSSSGRDPGPSINSSIIDDPPKRASSSYTGLSTSIRSFVGNGWRGKTKTAHITTKVGQRGAGETETEADEPPRHLPTTRILPASTPLIPEHTLTTILFEASRLLSIVPAFIGAIVNAWCIWRPPGSSMSGIGQVRNMTSSSCQWGRRTLPDRGDYFIAVLWACLTAAQCLALTTGLLRRWQAYYPPLPTLIRLLALQAICWPATHFTLNVLGSLGAGANCFLDRSTARSTLELELDLLLLRWTTVRPEVCWAVIGTTTCVSRSIQLWVTSNLVTPSPNKSKLGPLSTDSRRMNGSVGCNLGGPGIVKSILSSGASADIRSARRWDWGVVRTWCIVPAGCLYLVMAWIGMIRRELPVGGC